MKERMFKILILLTLLVFVEIVYQGGTTKKQKKKIFKLLSFFIPLSIPRYALVAKIDKQKIIVIISSWGVLSIKKIFEIIVDINGNESPKPTPAPHKIAPINNVSNTISLNLFLELKIQENVNFVFGFIVRANEKAIAGRQ